MTIYSQPWRDTPVEGPFLRSGQAADFLNLSRTQFYALARIGALPRPFKIGGRAAGLPQSWLNAVLRARAAESMEAAQ